MVLELRGDRAVLGPVPGVVRPHRELVDQHPAVAWSRTAPPRARPVTSSSPAIRSASRCACAGQRRVQVRRRGDHLAADAVALHRLHDRVRRRLAAGRARHQGRQLAPEVDPLLGEQRDAGRRPRRRPPRSPPASATTQTPLPSYPPRAVFSTHGKPEGLDVRRPTRPARCAGTGRRARPAGPASPPCPGRAPAPRGPGGRRCRRLQRLEVAGGHVLVVEGDHLAAARDRAQHARGRGSRPPVVGDHLGGRHALGPRPAAAAGSPARPPAPPSSGRAARRR